MPHVYLLHFDQKLEHAGHYCGWTPNGVEQRLEKHLKGNGAKLVKAVVASGRAVVVAATWKHDDCQEARRQERQMKQTHNLARYCPVCGSREWKADKREMK